MWSCQQSSGLRIILTIIIIIIIIFVHQSVDLKGHSIKRNRMKEKKAVDNVCNSTTSVCHYVYWKRFRGTNCYNHYRKS